MLGGISPSAGRSISPSASRCVSQAVVIVICQLAISSVKLLAVDRRARPRTRSAGRRPAPPGPRQVARDQLAVASMWPGMSVNGRAWPASASRASSAVDDVERAQELADRVRRVADVEVLRDAAEQMVAGDQQALLGLVQADVRRRVAGRLDHLPGPGVGLDRHARDQVAVGAQRRPPGRSPPAAALRPALRAAPRARRSGARSRSCGRCPAGARRAASTPGASRPRSPRARRSAAPARSDRCGRG